MIKYSHFEIFQYFKKKFEGEQKCVYEDLKEILEFKEKLKIYENIIDLPLDIIYTEESLEENNDEDNPDENNIIYNLFLIVSTENIPESIKKRICFYKFYLSKLISPTNLKIVLIITDSNKLNDVEREFYKIHGIGVYVFKGKDHEELLIPMSLREQMNKDFENNRGKILIGNIPLFFDRYIHDAVKSIGGIRPEEFGDRYIDKRLMNKILCLKNILYYEDLLEFLNCQLTEKGNEHIFVNKIFDRLWEKYIGISYTKFLKSFDPILQSIFAENIKSYRDHYIHQFQVFLLGLIVLHHFCQDNKDYKDLQIKWLIVSSFHDFAYPIQLYDIWNKKFFKNALNLENSPVELELRSHFVENFLYWIGLIVDSFCKREQKWEDKNELIKFFYNKMTDGKNHGVIGSVSLLTMVQNFRPAIERKLKKGHLENILVPSALSIAIHDDDIWVELKNEKFKKFKNKGLIFEDDTISFLLILCDNIQEWGRPSHNDKYEKYIENRFYLEKFDCDGNAIQIVMCSHELDKDEEIFVKKRNDLIKLENFLQSYTIKVSICLKDKNKIDYSFNMGL